MGYLVSAKHYGEIIRDVKRASCVSNSSSYSWAVLAFHQTVRVCSHLKRGEHPKMLAEVRERMQSRGNNPAGIRPEVFLGSSFSPVGLLERDVVLPWQGYLAIFMRAFLLFFSRFPEPSPCGAGF